MALLDGKYEIISQDPSEGNQTVFHAIAPDGSSLVIIWFDLKTARDELQFEQFRQLLRQLRKRDLAAIHDIVSRPGAHYLAWYAPNGSGRAKATDELATLLQDYGYSPEMADIRQDRGVKAQVFYLPFEPGQFSPTPPVLEPPLETPAKRKRHIPRAILSWSLSAFLLAAGFGFGTLGFVLQTNDASVVIPELTGLSANEASRRLFDLKLAVNLQAIPSTEAPLKVLGTIPSAGAVLRPYHRKVQLNYAVPADQLALSIVPELRKSIISEQVKTQLERLGFELGKLAYIYADAPSGSILAQSLTPGSKANEAEVIHLLISKGPRGQLSFLPDLTGLSLEDARFLIGIAGLRAPEVVMVDEPFQTADTVQAQSIAPFEPISRESSIVRLYVAKEGEDASSPQTPALIGMSLEQARQLAAALPITIEEMDEPNLPAGVVDQDPEPGMASAGGLKLLINVYMPPVPIPQPTISATVREPKERELSFAWFIEPGIKQSLYKVVAITPDGEELQVALGVTKGGETVQGSFVTKKPSPIKLRLLLQGEPYSIDLLRN